MHTQGLAPLTPDDVQVMDNVLRDTAVSGTTRRELLARAGATAAVVSALSAAGPIDSALAAASGTDSAQTVLNTAITAEALAVTYVTGLIQNASKTGVGTFVGDLKAVNAAEYDHYQALQKLGAKPVALKFWAPDAFFAPGKPFAVLQTFEALFVNAYLIGITTFAKAGSGTNARYASEIAGVEGQHLALVRYAQKELPNDIGFAQYKLKTMSAVVKAIEAAGVGLGKPGKKPGKFYTFAPPPGDTITAVASDQPS